jgi:ABC-type transporter Mla subunit MlaD
VENLSIQTAAISQNTTQLGENVGTLETRINKADDTFSKFSTYAQNVQRLIDTFPELEAKLLSAFDSANNAADRSGKLLSGETSKIVDAMNTLHNEISNFQARLEILKVKPQKENTIEQKTSKGNTTK